MLYRQRKYSHLYLLKAEEWTYFKIGQSVDVKRRILEISRRGDIFTPTEAVKMKCILREIPKIEKALHFLFKPYNVDRSNIEGPAGRSVSGGSEWFRPECYDAVVGMMKMFRAMRPDAIGEIEEVAL